MERAVAGVRGHVLLIEGDPSEAAAVRALLDEAGAPFELSCAPSLNAGLELLAAGGADAVLLGMAPPESRAIAELRRLLEAAPATAVVVVAASEGEGQAMRAVHAGAQDYLIREQIGGAALVRSLQHAIERQRLLVGLLAAHQAELRRRGAEELQTLEAISGPAATSVTAQMFGLAPLRDALPEMFRELVGRYAELLEQSVEQRSYKVEHNITEGLRALVDQLGFLRAGPRDVVDLHATVMRRAVAEAPQARAHTYVEEGRLTVLELMGHLVLFYRSYSIGVRRPPAAREGAGGAGGKR
jgi:DNA-binding NarL/FixJ family response regulator